MLHISDKTRIMSGLYGTAIPAISVLILGVGLVRVGETSSAVPLRSPDSARSEAKEKSMTVRRDNGIIDVPSKHSVEATVEKLKGILLAKGVTLFALIDHSGEAQKVGLKMPPTRLLIFGTPKAGTPVMLAAPHSALDLPLKILIWEDTEGKVWVTYNSPAYLQERHSLPTELLQNIAVVETLAAQAGD